MNLFSVSMLNKLSLVASLLMSIQWLDVIPHLLIMDLDAVKFQGM